MTNSATSLREQRHSKDDSSTSALTDCTTLAELLDGRSVPIIVNVATSKAAILPETSLHSMTERHKLAIDSPQWQSVPKLIDELHADAPNDVIIEVVKGAPSRGQIGLAKNVMAQGKRTYFYWPCENALEVVTENNLTNYWNVWFLFTTYQWIRATILAIPERFPILKTFCRWFKKSRRLGARAVRSVAANVPFLKQFYRRVVRGLPAEKDVCVPTVEAVHAQATPIPLPIQWASEEAVRIRGCGVYLRTDFWNKMSSGGSYGHTCYVAKELANVTEDFLAFLPHWYGLMENLDVKQHVLRRPGRDCNESTIAGATPSYYRQLKHILTSLRPPYLYERLCLGNYAGAALCQELKIPYVVEYNGSECSMKRSFDGAPYELEESYVKAEAAAFAQASLISVVSEAVKSDLISRGVPEAKILVNPNGADPEQFAPVSPAERERLIRKCGWSRDNCVIGFTGTFGKWHGIEVLAAAIPQIAEQIPNARFLLIGDGQCKQLLDDVIARENLKSRLRCVGRVPQKKGARLLGACDVFLSPHHRHMVDSRFFGSPTKVFEYMAMGQAIVASDLEQIGEVLSPAIHPENLNSDLSITNQRSVLCEPGNVDQLVYAVVEIVKRPQLRKALGDNARKALVEKYSWKQHVRKLWAHPSAIPGAGAQTAQPLLMTQAHLKRILTKDAYKDEVQNQWNQDPCGSQYVKASKDKTLEWYLEAERFRYEEYAPWMLQLMEFDKHAGERVLEIGAGMGTDLAQFAMQGAQVTDLDLSAGHLEKAKESFRLRGLHGEFVHHDAETLPFEDNTFDVIYSNGVIHHTPKTDNVVSEIHRVLKPGGKAIVMVYAEHSYHYWTKLVFGLGVRRQLLSRCSMSEIMSRHVELTSSGAKPLVKVYTKKRLCALFHQFATCRIYKRQLLSSELFWPLRWLPRGIAERIMGWNLIIKAVKGQQQ